MAHPQGLEPRTPCLEGRCSIQLSYGCVDGNSTVFELVRELSLEKTALLVDPRITLQSRSLGFQTRLIA